MEKVEAKKEEAKEEERREEKIIKLQKTTRIITRITSWPRERAAAS